MTAVQDSTIFVVGGDTDLGRLIALQLVRAGTQRIGLIGTDAARAEATAQEVFRAASGMWALSATGDLSSPDDVERMFAELSGSLGDPDILIECSGEKPVVRERAVESMRQSGQGSVLCVGAGQDSADGVVRIHAVSPGDDSTVTNDVMARLV